MSIRLVNQQRKLPRLQKNNNSPQTSIEMLIFIYLIQDTNTKLMTQRGLSSQIIEKTKYKDFKVERSTNY